MVEQIQIQRKSGGGKDRTLSYLCFRGGHIKCKGRSCTCDCHTQ